MLLTPVLLLHVALREREGEKEEEIRTTLLHVHLLVKARFLNRCISIRDKDLKSQKDGKCWNL